MGVYGIQYNVLNNPKRFKIYNNSTLVADSGFVGADGSNFQQGGATYGIYTQYSINPSNEVTYTNVVRFYSSIFLSRHLISEVIPVI